MNDLFITFLSLSVAGTFLIFILFSLKPIYKNKLCKRWQYYIWIVVVARFLLPFAPKINLVGSCFTAIDTQVIQPVKNAYFGMGNDLLWDKQQENKFELLEDAEKTEQEILSESENENYAGISRIWIIVAIVLLIRKVTVYQSFVKYVRAGSKEVSDIERLEEFGKIIEEQGIKTRVELYTNNLISTPLLIGFWKPCIILPTINISTVDFRYTVLHELSHFKYKDILYKWLTQITVCIHWFNPFVYFMCKEINCICELSCDESVASKLSEQEKRDYGNTLLNAVNTGGNYKNSIASMTLCESGRILGERLSAIMTYQKVSRKNWYVSIAFAVLLLFTAFCIGSYSVPKQNSMQAPNNTKTAHANNIIQIENPNVEIVIDNNAAVDFIATTDNVITVDYDDTLYNVAVYNENGNWQVHISYIGSYSKYPSAVLYVPAISYGNVDLEIENATIRFNSVFQNSDTINLDMKSSSVFYILPADFTGEINANAPNCYVELYSDSAYKNCVIIVSNWCSDAEDFEIASSNYGSLGVLENSFIKQNGNLIYSNGTESGIINIDFQKNGYFIIK